MEVIRSDPWARDSCLLAISAHSNDGVSGLKHDGSFEAVREELKAQPHIIFSANPGGPRVLPWEQAWLRSRHHRDDVRGA